MDNKTIDAVIEIVDKEIEEMEKCKNVKFPPEIMRTEKAVKLMADTIKIRMEFLKAEIEKLRKTDSDKIQEFKDNRFDLLKKE